VSGKAATLLGLVYGLLLAALATRRAEAAWMAAPLLTALAFGLLRAPAPGTIRLSARRSVRRDPGGAVEVSIAVRNDGRAPVHLRLSDPPPPTLGEISGATRTRALLSVGEEAALAYTLRAPRGQFLWRSVQATTADPLGMVEEHLRLPAPAEFHLLPEAPRLRPIPLRPGRTLPSPGSIPARVGGSGTEFFGVREYQVGDSLRWLDWRLTARHPGRLFTKEFEQEQIADVGLVLDARGAVEHRVGEESLFEHSVRAAASLAATFLRQGNRVSLLALGEPEMRIYPGVGRVQLQRILSCLAGVRVAADRWAHDPGHSFARLFPARSILVVLTPLVVDGASFLLRLKAHGRQVLLVSPDPVEFGAGAEPPDPISRLALRAARVERQLALRAIAQRRITVIDWRVDRPLHPLIRGALRPLRGGRPGSR